MEAQITGATVWLEIMLNLELLELSFAAFKVKCFKIKDPWLCYHNLSLNIIKIDFSTEDASTCSQFQKVITSNNML